jgi:hypothetical protein
LKRLMIFWTCNDAENPTPIAPKKKEFNCPSVTSLFVCSITTPPLSSNMERPFPVLPADGVENGVRLPLYSAVLLRHHQPIRNQNGKRIERVKQHSWPGYA